MNSTSLIIPCQEFDTGRPKLSLDGAWSFAYDPDEIGEKEKWFLSPAHLPEKTRVPGCPQAERHRSAGKAPAPAQGIFPPAKFPCTAPAWYAKTFDVPSGWQGQEIWLRIGGVFPAALIWCNGCFIGQTRSSRTPLRCNLTGYLRTGKPNTLTFKLYNPPGSRLDGCFDGPGWAGIYRSIWLEAVPPVCFRDIFIRGRVHPPAALIEIMLQGRPTQDLSITCNLAQKGHGQSYVKQIGIPRGGKVCLGIAMPGARLWSPGDPILCEARLVLRRGSKVLDRARIRFGLREIRTRGTKILLNGQAIFLRGGCDDQVYPQTVCPPASTDFYKKRIRLAKQYGFNYTKGCVEIFTREFLEAADECGYLVCQEMPFGLHNPQRAMRRAPSRQHAALLRRELRNIVVADRNHPSVIIRSMTSELYINPMYGQGAQNRASFKLFCRELPRLARLLSPHTLVCDITGSTTIAIRTRFGRRDTDLLEEGHEGQISQCPLCGPLKGFNRENLDQVKRPFLLHEYNWWTCLPDPKILKRYRATDVVIRPIGLPEMCRQAKKHGLASQLPVFVRNSRALKYALRKYGLELARRHPKIAGYHHWLIHDFGCWCPEGVFNEFWEAPRDLSAAEFTTYNSDTVLLWEDQDRRVFEWGQRLPLAFKLSHYGREALENAELAWFLSKGRQIIVSGKIQCPPVVPGALALLGRVRTRLPAGQRAARLELRAELRIQGRRICWNHWPLWAYPALVAIRPEMRCVPVTTDLPCVRRVWPRTTALQHPCRNLDPAAVVVTSRLTAELVDFVARGGRLVLFVRGLFKDILSATADPPRMDPNNLIGITASAVYRTSAYNSSPHGNMGTVMRAHPVLGDLAGDRWCDFNFARLIQGIYPVDLEIFRPARINPIIRAIGSYQTMRDKAYLFEIGVGRGALLVNSLGIEPRYDHDLTARYLLRRMLEYVIGPRFAPRTRISRADFERALYRLNPLVYSPFVTQWQVSLVQPVTGPFASVAYPRRPAALRFQVREYPSGFCDLRRAWMGAAARAEFVYLACRFACAAPMRLTVGLGYDGPVKVWLDGRGQFCDPRGASPMGTDKAKILFDAATGQHEVMIALASNGGRAWGARLRILRPAPPLFSEPEKNLAILKE